MKEISDIPKRDFLENPDLKKNTYVLPSGYLNALENSVHERIHAKSSYNIIARTKPYVFLVASFALIFGICYGALNLFTGTQIAKESHLITLIDDGYLESSFIDYYYDEIEFDSSDKAEMLYLGEELSQEIEESLTEEDLLNYY